MEVAIDEDILDLVTVAADEVMMVGETSDFVAFLVVTKIDFDDNIII